MHVTIKYIQYLKYLESHSLGKRINFAFIMIFQKVLLKYPKLKTNYFTSVLKNLKATMTRNTLYTCLAPCQTQNMRMWASYLTSVSHL